MTRIQRLAAISAVAATALAGACKESSSPSAPDPTALATAVTTLNSAFAQNAVFQGLMAISATAVLAAPPVLPGLLPAPRGTSLAGERDLMLRLAGRAGGPMLALFPVNVLGKTFQWDTASGGHYRITDSTLSGAPSNGIRFILYQVDTGTMQPRLPLTTTGTVDLSDVSNASSNGIHLLLKVGSQTAADYTVTEVKATTSITLTAVGNVQDVVTSGPQITFTLTHELSLTDSSLNTDYQASGNGATASLQTGITGATGNQSEAFDWLLQKQGSVEAIGESNADSTNIQIRLNGSTFATVRDITGGTTSLTGPNGGTLTLGELTALESILEGFAAVFANLSLVFFPTLLFLV
jgi:hypothetical protein